MTFCANIYPQAQLANARASLSVVILSIAPVVLLSPATLLGSLLLRRAR
jgi:hypothetical protein